MYTTRAKARKPSPWNVASPEQAAERERFIELNGEAWRADPVRGALATRAILPSDLQEIFDAKQFDLLHWLRNWTALLPASCLGCGVRLNAPADIGGFSITAAAIAQPRFAMISGFCESCAANGHHGIRATTLSALQRDRIATEIIGEKRG